MWIMSASIVDVESDDSAPPILTRTGSAAPSGSDVCSLMTQDG